MTPIDRCTHTGHLSLYMSPVFTDPFSTGCEEFFSTDFFSRSSSLAESLLHSRLSRYSCMIGSWYPESRIPEHTMVAYHDILECEHEGMSDMKLSCDIRGGNRYIEALSCA